MKRLLAAGFSPIVQIGKAWRAGEQGRHHQPEFTIVEWYRAGAPLERIAQDCEEILRVAVHAAQPSQSRDLDLEAPFERTTVTAVMRRLAAVELSGDETPEELRAKLQSAGVAVGQATAWDDLFFQAFLDRVEPHLGRERPTFVFDWPLPLGALARRKPGAPGLVERFELYAGGLELANAFGELTDPREQRSRFEDESRQRAARGKDVYPTDEKLLAALAHMPPTAGVALGFDRLVMLALGADDIREVIAFADDEA
jgi:lysyl-tRNA synthetase class 2